MAKIKLSAALEKQLLAGLISGALPASLIRAEELSKEGRQILNACNYLRANGASFPVEFDAVLLAAASLGADREGIGRTIAAIKDVSVGSSVEAIGRAARSKEALVNIINEAGEQLANGALDSLKLNSLISQASSITASELSPLADKVSDHFPVPPKGIQIRSLESINDATNGIIGIWVIGGMPGLGKSTLAMQLALDIGNRFPVLYYDLDGTGEDWIIDHIRTIVSGNVEDFKRVTAQLHLRDNIRTLDGDLAVVKPPAFIVVDSLQTLPTSVNFRRSSLDKWLNETFKELSKRGYTILLVSEVGRGSYENVNMGAYKESGEIEYAGTCNIQLSGDPKDETAPVQFHITKSRHTKRKGHIVDLERDPKRVFWFKETKGEWA